MRSLLVNILALYRAEPVRCNAAIVNLVVLVASYFHFVIDPDSVWQVLAFVGAVTGFAELTRRSTSPAK